MANYHTQKIPRSLRGYLVAYVEESIGHRDIRVCGDPEGLRSLGEALLAIANLDQSELDERECPAGDSFHQHYQTANADARGLPRLTIERVDEKATGRVRECYVVNP